MRFIDSRRRELQKWNRETPASGVPLPVCFWQQTLGFLELDTQDPQIWREENKAGATGVFFVFPPNLRLFEFATVVYR